MPKREDIQTILVIGSGPIVIGQACEFDYSGAQACKVLKADGYRVVLVNSNPATIMTDPGLADRTYVEPITVEFVEQVIAKERPDALLPTLGGQTGLNTAVELARAGILAKYGVEMIGCDLEAIERGEDRKQFNECMAELGIETSRSGYAYSIADAEDIVAELGYPVVLRPSFTLGGAGGGIAHDAAELHEIVGQGLELSPAGEVLVEESIEGWKEYEMEVMRDRAGNGIIVCSIENFDAMGVHTGDSITVAPAQTLSDVEYQRMRAASLAILEKIGVETGGSNVQFAVNPENGRMIVIEMNPRVSRSSALASKATGFPIAKAAAKLAVGYTLDEIVNDITKATPACFEPSIDYCVVKVPRFAFEKFQGTDDTLSTRMKAVGEVMAIGRTFEESLGKAMRSLENGRAGLGADGKGGEADASDEALEDLVARPTAERIFYLAEALRRGWTVERASAASRVDPFFVARMADIVRVQENLRGMALDELDADAFRLLKRMGLADAQIAHLTGSDELTVRTCRKMLGVRPAFKTVDTCAAEFPSATAYHYKTYDADETETAPKTRRRAMILGAGPNRIGQGIEFDYCCVHASYALHEAGFETIMVNCNPETVSTDYDTSDKLYFEPLTPEDVTGVVEAEKPDYAIVQFGGQTAINLAAHLEKLGVPILGTPAWSIDAAEDREKFDVILEKCGIPRPAGHTVMTEEEAVKAADELGYPVLVRPSYVLGGQGMEIAYKEADVREFMQVITRNKVENPVLVDKYMMGREIEVDAICDGDDILIPGIMEHFERAGVHSGDSISIYPSINIEQKHKDTLVKYTEALAKNLAVLGLVNIQFVLYNDQIYVIEVNPRSSRTVPYISKVTGVPMVDLATRCMFGEKLKDMGCGTGLHPESDHYAVKVPVFSFQKLRDLDTQLGPEMKSTGEVLGVAKTFREALLKGLTGAGFQMKKKGAVLISVRDSDKQEAIRIGERFEALGFDIYATSGTANVLNRHMVATNSIRNVDEPSPNIIDLIESGKIDYVVATSVKGRHPELGSVHIRRTAVERAIPCLTSMDTVSALLRCLEGDVKIENCEMVDINTI